MNFACEKTAQRGSGFTLIEVLAAVFLSSIVIGVAIAFYLNLSDSSMRASDLMQRSLHASAVLERVARDIEGAALLVKPEETDPLAHPWFFVATSRFAFDGADQLKFVTRTLKPRVSEYHSSDIGVVAFFVEPTDVGGYTLYRWLSPGPPLAYDPSFPQADSTGSFELAEGLRSFSLHFLQADGEWVTEWDSTQLVQSSQLPTVVEISLSLLDDALEVGNENEEDVVYFTRRVALPLRPIDLAGMMEAKLEAATQGTLAGILGGAGGDGGAEGGSAGAGMTVGQLVQQNFALCVSAVNTVGGEAICNALAGSSESVCQAAGAGIALPAQLSALVAGLCQ